MEARSSSPKSVVIPTELSLHNLENPWRWKSWEDKIGYISGRQAERMGDG
jgi:hypothetical protein